MFLSHNIHIIISIPSVRSHVLTKNQVKMNKRAYATAAAGHAANPWAM